MSAEDAVYRIIAARIPDAVLRDGAVCTSDLLITATARNCYEAGSTPRLMADNKYFARLNIGGGGIDDGAVFVTTLGQVLDALVILHVCNAAPEGLPAPVQQAAPLQIAVPALPAAPVVHDWQKVLVGIYAVDGKTGKGASYAELARFAPEAYAIVNKGNRRDIVNAQLQSKGFVTKNGMGHSARFFLTHAGVAAALSLL